MAKWFSLLFFLLLLTSCGISPLSTSTSVDNLVPTAQISLHPTPFASNTPLPTILPVATTQMRKPTNLPAPTKTTPPTFTLNLPTHTPSVEINPDIKTSVCIPTSKDVAPPPDFLFVDTDSGISVDQQENDAIEYLNTYGIEALVKAIQAAGNGTKYYYQDFTKDGFSDIGLTLTHGIGSWFDIFGCQDGEHHLLYTQTSTDAYLSAYQIVYVRDGNRNGTPEITFLTGYASQGGHGYEMIEWNGAEFKQLLLSAETEYLTWGNLLEGYVNVEASGDVYYQDIDGDNIDEFVVNTGIPTWEIYLSGLPFQNVLRYHKWDGEHYAFLNQYYGPPEYRFQAIQNGDRLSKLGEYDLALEMYQRAIYSDKLEWWSEERHLFLQELWRSEMREEATPIPPMEGVDEYPNLAAYARYRIVLLHIVQGYSADAQVVYDTLQEKFTEGQIGHAYAEMATAFWEEYQVSKDLEKACSRAAEYASEYPAEILSYLGQSEHAVAFFGDQSLEYTPEDICPFR